MKEVKIYPNIDMQRTGIRLKEFTQKRGYCVADIQEYLHLSCPQPVYRWFKGMILPSVDHLLMLSELLGVHMEDLLVKKQIRCVLPFRSYGWNGLTGLVRYIFIRRNRTECRTQEYD